MKVRIEIDESLTEKEVVIKVPALDETVQQLYRQLQTAEDAKLQLRFYKGATEYYLALDDILFFETEGRQVNAHTVDDIFETHQHLYELENQLPGTFMRISKSAILNIDKIFALTHSISSSLVEFQQTQKQVYVSRKYYPVLRQRLEDKQWGVEIGFGARSSS